MSELDPTLRAFLVSIGRVGARAVTRALEGVLEEADETVAAVSGEARKRISRAKDRARNMRKRQENDE